MGPAVSSSVKHENFVMVALIIVLIFWAVIDTALSGITTLPIAVFAVILHLFISFQQSGIYTDTLKGMNNSRKAELYLSEEVSNNSADTPLYMFMGDINNFKGINDQYGHHEGYIALVIFAEAIKKKNLCV